MKPLGLLVLLLSALPLHAQNHGEICASIGQGDVATDICRAQLQLYEDNYRRDLRAAAALMGDPQQFMQEGAQALDHEIAQCQNFECIRIAYVNETQRLQAIKRGTIESTTTWMPPAGNDQEDPDSHSPNTVTTQSTSTEEAPVRQQPEAINADSLTVGETSPPISAATQQFDQTGIVAKPPSSGAHVLSNGETHKGSFIDQLTILSLWAALGCVLLLLLLAATNHVVVFYDGLDVWWSFAPLLSLAIGYMVARSVASEDAGTSFLEILVMGIAVLISALSTVINYRNAIQHNRSMALGLIIGTLKIAAATFTVISVAGQLSRLNDPEGTRRQRANAMLILTVIGFVWWMLVNGQRVYEKRGWQPVPAT